jgi:sugar/nucleoside kinase (ribokinase family)
VVSLLDATGERTMLSDRVSLDPSQMATAAAGAEWVHCSAYALADEATGDLLAEALGSLPPSTRVSAGGGSLHEDPERSGRVRRRLASAGVDLLVMGRDEAAALLDRQLPSLPAAADALALEFPGVIAVVTGAAAGSAAAGPGFAISVPAADATSPMVDATGAGDAYTAALIVRLGAAGWPPDAGTLRDAMERGSRDGGLVARLVGAQARTPTERAL